MPAAFALGGTGMKVGEVVSTVVIQLSAETKFERNGKSVKRDLLQKGDRVGVAARRADARSPLIATWVVLGMKAEDSKKQR